jgi:LmbE family N-acetylglucosaminyl deacetylase
VYKGRPKQKRGGNIHVPNCAQPEPKPHPCANFNFAAKIAALAVVLALTLSPVRAQDAASQLPPAGPLPQDQGAAGLKEMLLRLKTTARMMHTTAHPDDEDGGMMTLESRGKGDSILLLTLNRGEGGQNKVGSGLFDELGIVRTLEQLAADRYYGVEQRFTRVVDFGFSKTADETFQKWGGHDLALGDMVRVLRTYRPDVLVTRFQGADRDGHGNHQAAGIVTREAFRAAADPNRFPEQLKEGLLPWQAKKLYTDNVHQGEEYTVVFDTGAVNPALGISYVQFAIQGLRHELSQGVGYWHIEPGEHLDYYKMIDSVLPPLPAGAHEKDFFDGIDTSVPALAERLGSEQSKVPQLKSELEDFQERINKASDEARKSPDRAAEPLLQALAVLNRAISDAGKAGLGPAARLDLMTRLEEKQRQCEKAVNLAMNTSLQATVAPASGPPNAVPPQPEALTLVSPGQVFTVIAKFHNGFNKPIEVRNVSLQGGEEWILGVYKGQNTKLKPGEDYYANFRLRVPGNAAYTRPYFHRASPEDAVYQISDPRYLTLPLPPPPLQVKADYYVPQSQGHNFTFVGHDVQLAGAKGWKASEVVTVTAPYQDAGGQQRDPTLAVGPAFSVMLNPSTQVVPLSDSSCRVMVNVHSDVSGAASGTLRLELPQGWKAEPRQAEVAFTHRGQERQVSFNVLHSGLREGRERIRAVFDSGGATYAEGYAVITRPDIETFYYYEPALQQVSVVDVKVPRELKVGYIMGAGDDIPQVLREIGMNVAMISPQELAGGDLSHYDTIVLGIRAYDTQDDVRAHNARLLDYVKNGGTLMVQYNQQLTQFNDGKYTPYPAQESHDRVTVEESPVQILAPQDGVFHYPNQITGKDFDSWVQERGLYFMDTWDSHFQPLLASHDPGESPLKGGLLLAHYGKGIYIYNAYSFFRELPTGVPGAIRLYVNLLSAGHEKQVSKLQGLKASGASAR